METSLVRRRVSEAIERAKRTAADRRVKVDEAERDWPAVLEGMAIPLVRQVANVLKVESFAFTISTPSRSVRLTSDRRPEDFVEVTLDTSGREPVVMGRASRTRAGHVVVSERPIGNGSLRALTEDDVLAFLIDAIEPMIER